MRRGEKKAVDLEGNSTPRKKTRYLYRGSNVRTRTLLGTRRKKKKNEGSEDKLQKKSPSRA